MPEVVVIGAGPAGMAAACCAAESGAEVTVVDDNPEIGGQIWRRPKSGDAMRWLDRIRAAPITRLQGTQVIGQVAPGRLLAEREGEPLLLDYRKLILATGARELFLPFPGWTLPGVMGAGGLQAMVKSGLPMEGRRVVVAGSGPLLLAVADYLLSQRAEVVALVEQAPWWRVTRFGLSLIYRAPSKLRQAIALKRRLRSIPAYFGAWVRKAEGEGRLEQVIITHRKRSLIEPCDYLACGYGLVPNLELPRLLGCMIVNGTVRIDEDQQTSRPGVYCVGEPTGIGGLELSLIEGQIAGYHVAGEDKRATKLYRARQHAWSFARALERTFRLREELRHLAEPETLVCRCEDVPFEKVVQCGSQREAKLQTRCGMGPCQGRVCNAITEHLFGWSSESVRPPVLPASLATLGEPSSSV